MHFKFDSSVILPDIPSGISRKISRKSLLREWNYPGTLLFFSQKIFWNFHQKIVHGVHFWYFSSHTFRKWFVDFLLNFTWILMNIVGDSFKNCFKFFLRQLNYRFFTETSWGIRLVITSKKYFEITSWIS